MKKLSVIFLILIFAISLFVVSCSASGGVTIGKLQSEKTARVTK